MTVQDAYEFGFKLALDRRGLTVPPSEKTAPPKKSKDKDPKPVGYNYVQGDMASGTWK